nr:MAG TPA: hypothetical protein [Caudoviricetes sp.]
MSIINMQLILIKVKNEGRGGTNDCKPKPAMRKLQIPGNYWRRVFVRLHTA